MFLKTSNYIPPVKMKHRGSDKNRQLIEFWNWRQESKYMIQVFQIEYHIPGENKTTKMLLRFNRTVMATEGSKIP